jgi:phenylalanyl-tRNA synthetase alpha chain
MEKLSQIKAEALKQIEESDALEKLNDVRVNFLGKKGELTAVLKSMKDVTPEERPKFGQLVNTVREEIEASIEQAKKKMEQELRETRLKAEVIVLCWKKWSVFLSEWAMKLWKDLR